MNATRHFLIVAGEVSGDRLAARLVRAMQKQDPGCTFSGIGGQDMRDAGVNTLYDVEDMAVVGLTEVLLRYPFFCKVFHHLLRHARQKKPNAVILVDYPGFNLRFAEKAHALGFNVFFYVCPQVWAWNRGRIPKIARSIDRMFSFFPFEAGHFEGTGLPVTFIGHPLAESAERVRKIKRPALAWNGHPRVALLPGSRTQEVERNFPPMWTAAGLIQRDHPNASFFVPTSSQKISNHAAKLAFRMRTQGPSRWEIMMGQTHQVLVEADAAWVASGTATLEAALLDCPMVVVYRTSWMNYILGRHLIKIPHIGLVNIVAGHEVCPELIQQSARPEALANAIRPFLTQTPRRATVMAELKRVQRSLSAGGGEAQAAQAILEDLRPAHQKDSG